MPAEALLAMVFMLVLVLGGRAARRRCRRALVARRLQHRPSTSGTSGLLQPGARLAAAAGAGALVGGLPMAAVTTGALALSGTAARVMGRASRAERYDADVVAFLLAFARSLRSGAAVHAALEESAAVAGGDLAADLGLLVGRLDRGSTLVDGLRRWADERPRPAVRSTAAALALGHETGGLRAEIVDSVATAVRQGLDARAEARGLATQARASALVLAFGPLVFLVLGLVGRSAATEFLLGTPLGLACLLGGLLLDAAALLFMLRLVSGVGR